jgi:hypothetical protein
MPLSTAIATITLEQALRIIGGARPPGDDSTERAAVRWEVNERIFARMPGSAPSRHVGQMSAEMWCQLANLPFASVDLLGSGLLPGPGLKATLDWIASAPEQYAEMAVSIGALYIRKSAAQKLFASLLRGAAGPYARIAVPGCVVMAPRIFAALLELPQPDLEAITAAHARSWPCYADRILAESDAWADRDAEGLLEALQQISSRDAAVWAIRREFPNDPKLDLLRRLPPSPQMLSVMERFGKPEVVRELHAARVARQLQAARPDQDDDSLPQMEMI